MALYDTPEQLSRAVGPGAREAVLVADVRARAEAEGFFGARKGVFARFARELLFDLRRLRRLEREAERRFEKRREEQRRLSAKKRLTKRELRRLEKLERETGMAPGSCATLEDSESAIQRTVDTMVARAQSLILERDLGIVVTSRVARVNRELVEGEIMFWDYGDPELVATIGSLMTLKNEQAMSFRNRYFMFCPDDRQTWIRVEVEVLDSAIIRNYGRDRARFARYWFPTGWAPYQRGPANRLVQSNLIDQRLRTMAQVVIPGLSRSIDEEFQTRGYGPIRIRIARTEDEERPRLERQRKRDRFVFRRKEIEREERRKGKK